MKRFILLSVCSVCLSTIQAQKKIYIPEDLRGMDLQADTSQWSFKRSAQTDDLIFMWERGFGQDVSNPPMLDGKPMSFNLNNLIDCVQSFYTFFRDTLAFSEPGSKADQYKMMVMVMYSLDGTAYGGTYDNFIGSLWVAPNRIQDTKMNCMAHELGHSFQLQIPADSVGDAWGGSGFFEMTSQWMLWQVNPDWLTDENFHFEAFKKLTHKAYLHLENIYHSPYVIQWWSDLHGRKSIAELYRQGKIGEDPVLTYMRLYGLSQEEFREAVRKERWNEFILEGHRWFDLKRWHILVKYVKGHSPASESLKIQNVSKRNYYLPLPQDQLILNPNLEQNWGYSGETGDGPYGAEFE